MSTKSKRVTEPKKLFTMKVPATKLEQYHRLAKSYDLPLSHIIQRLLDQEELPKKKRSRPLAKIDPLLMRQLSAIGNNVNQIARRVNSGDLSALSELHAIEFHLRAIRDAHKIH